MAGDWESHADREASDPWLCHLLPDKSGDWVPGIGKATASVELLVQAGGMALADSLGCAGDDGSAVADARARSAWD